MTKQTLDISKNDNTHWPSLRRLTTVKPSLSGARYDFLKAVHHTDDNHRAHLKHWVNLYHDRVRDAVRDINKIRACCRMRGVRIPRKVVRKPIAILSTFVRSVP